MASQIIPLLRNELTKAARRKLPYFGFIAVGLVCVIVYFIGGQLSNAASANAWGYVGFSMQMVFTDIGPIFVINFAALLIAEETGTGTIRSALAAPVQRWEFYVAKALTALAYMVALSMATLLISTALALFHFRFGAVSDASGIVYGRGLVLRELLTSFLFSWIPLGTLALYGLLISTLIRSPGAAAAVGTSSMFIIEFTKHLAGIDPFIFTRYTIYPWLTMGLVAQGMDYQWKPEIWKMITLCAESAAVLLGAGLIVFVKEDLNH